MELMPEPQVFMDEGVLGNSIFSSLWGYGAIKANGSIGHTMEWVVPLGGGAEP